MLRNIHLLLYEQSRNKTLEFSYTLDLLLIFTSNNR